MFIYFQSNSKAKWEHVFLTEEAMQQLKDKKVPMQSVLSVKEPIEEEEDKHGLIYKGPFYVDIDVSTKFSEAELASSDPEVIARIAAQKIEDTETSIESAKEFSDKLEEMDVHSYRIYLSGKKGFHFIIDQEAFSKPRPVKSLPLVYKEMALELYVEGLDMSVYNEGRPRLLRTPNVKRKDNGAYKVQVTLAELHKLTAESYAQLTSEPRKEFDPGVPSLSIKLQSIYEMCKSRMQKKVKAMENMEFIPDDELKKAVAGGIPGCINVLIEEGATKPNANFNQASIQFASFVVRAGLEYSEWSKLAQQMAANVKSSSYNTESKRLSELKKMVGYVGSANRYGFSKAALFSVIKPCGDCPICNGTVEDGAIIEEGYEEDLGIEETPHGYVLGHGKTRKKLTTFTFGINSKFVEQGEGGEDGIRAGVTATLKVNGHRRDEIILPESAWDSSKTFKDSIRGRENFAFLGNEQDLQRLKHYIFTHTKDLAQKNHVHSVGMHRYQIGDRTMLVYVEPGLSVTSNKERDTHEVWGSIPAPPCIADAKYPEPDEELKEFIEALLNINEPDVVAALIGWFSLCHIKIQLTLRDNQFPLLNLWGNAGCVDRDTEFLTPTGWKAIGDYVEGDKVCQWSPDGSTEFVFPEDYIRAPAEYLNHIQTTTVDMVVSDNHRMPYITSKGKFGVKPAEDLMKMRAVKVPRTFTAPATDGVELSDELIRVLVMQAADGSIVKKAKKDFTVVVRVKREDKKERAEKLLADSGLNYTMNHQKSGYTVFRYKPPVDIQTKSLARLWGCSADQIAVVYDEIYRWDGSVSPRRGEKNFTGNKENVDFCQYVYSVSGDRYASISKDSREYVNGDIYSVVESNRQHSTVEFNADKGSKVTPFKTVDGLQYCFTTPSSFWLARRNGKIFPTGNSGKSAISSLFGFLHGVDYQLEHSPMSLQGTTPWAVAQYCTTSESTPRLIEEFNQGEIPASRYDQFAGMFKAAWNKQTFAKGGIERGNINGISVSGAKVIEAKIAAPLCVMSEQAPDRPALRQRMIQVNVKRAGREVEGREENFYHVLDRRYLMKGLARAMVWESLSTHPDWVNQQMAEFKSVVPRSIDARPQFAYQSLLTGLRFFGKTLKTIGLEEAYVDEKVDLMISHVMDKIGETLEDIQIEKSKTEVSMVVADMAIMADMAPSGMPYCLEAGRDYFKVGAELYIDPVICHTLYVRWARSSGSKVIISKSDQFITLLKQEAFYVSEGLHPSFLDGRRKLLKLDCNVLDDRGIDSKRFISDVD